MDKRIEHDDGTIFYKNEYGELNRDDGPAIIYSNGDQIWCQNGLRHREDGPARINSKGKVSWWLDGKNYSFKEWCELVDISDELKMELGLKYG